MFGALVRTAGRMSFAPIFVIGGVNAAINPGGRPQKAAATIDKVRELVPMLPADDETVVRANGVVQAAAGVTLALGIFPKLSALALIGSMVPTTLAGHDFWNETDKSQRDAQRLQFVKNAAIIGGLLSVVGSRK